MLYRALPKPVIQTIFVSCLVLSAFCLPAYCEQLVGTVIAIESGDTFTLEMGNKTERIRLEGIDCPEVDQPFGNKAKTFTSRKILNKKVTVEVKSRDSYNGTWSVVLTPDGQDLNRELLKTGLAWWYHKYSDDHSLGELETKARLKHRGLWDQIAPMPPWDFRRGIWK